MTFSSTFGRVFSPTFQPKSQAAASAASTWWDLNGTITSCIAAYQPKGAASYAASLTDLSGNSNDAASTAAPDWDSTNGWVFDINTKYINTGVNPTADYSMIIRFTGAEPGHICGRRTSAGNNEFSILPSNNTARNYRLGTQHLIVGSAASTEGIMALVGGSNPDGYYNGSDDTTGLNGTTIQGTIPVYIGCANNNGSIGSHSTGNVQAFAIYNATLTSTQIGNLTTAMAAL